MPVITRYQAKNIQSSQLVNLSQEIKREIKTINQDFIKTIEKIG
jgi:hypothetical protein